MMSIRKTLLIIAGFAIAHSANAQMPPAGTKDAAFEKLSSRDIPGAPKLGKPILLENSNGALFTKGLGWASPAIFDVNNDGLDDLVLGEFGSGFEHHAAVGNFLRVYENTGTKNEPVYNKPSYYLRYDKKSNLYATPISINVWCCMAFTPRLTDLDGDGKADLVAGQYDTGEILLYKKMEESFDIGKRIPQTGLGGMLSTKRSAWKKKQSEVDTADLEYWSYATTAFVDLDGDGKQDLILGGTILRSAMNIGTKQSPAFGIRTILKDTKGAFLGTLDTASFKDKEVLQRLLRSEITGTHMIPYVVDWDNDNVEDLLVTNGYYKAGAHFITFFKGVRKGKKLSFLPGVPLFETKHIGEKIFPGSHPNICVADWNNDGIKDLIIGTCVTTNYGRYDPELSWQWEEEAHTYKKYPAYQTTEEILKLGESMRIVEKVMKDRGYTHDEAVKKKMFVPDMLYKNVYGTYGREGVAHDGRVYVLLGSNK